MAVSAVPGSLLGLIARDSSAIRKRLKARVEASPGARHFLTVAALVIADVVAWKHGLTAGGLSTAGALILIDYKLQGG